MRTSEFTTSEHALYPHLKISEHHSNGLSMYAIGEHTTDEGHLIVKAGGGGGFGKTASDKNLGMCLNVYGSSMDYADVSRTINNLVHPNNIEKLRGISKMEHGKDWYNGFTKMTDGFDMIAAGWDDGAKRASIGLADIPVPEIDGIESMRRTLMFSDYGETLNIDQAMAGNWDKAWQTCKRVTAGVSRVLSVAIPFGGNCDKKSDQMFWNGAQGMVITDILEEKGYRVQLYAVHAAQQPNYVWDVDIVNLKRSDEPLRMDSIAAVVAHAGVFRTAGFCSILSKPCEVGWGLGSCREESVPQVLDIVAELGYIHPGTITLDAAYSKDAAVEKIKDFFKRMKEGAYDGNQED